jgi:hypothetical protein
MYIFDGGDSKNEKFVMDNLIMNVELNLLTTLPFTFVSSQNHDKCTWKNKMISIYDFVTYKYCSFQTIVLCIFAFNHGKLVQILLKCLSFPSKVVCNKYVDIELGAHDAFLE